MADRKWYELVIGSLDDKKRYRAYKARMKQLPPDYRAAHAAVERYLTYAGMIGDGAVLLTMLDDLGELFEQGAADGTPIRELVGDDPAEFVDTFVQNYAKGQWITKERARLARDIDRAAAGEHGEQDG